MAYQCSNIIVSNNYISGHFEAAENGCNSTNYGLFANNVIAGYINVNIFNVINNIQISGTYTQCNFTPITHANNIGQGAQFGTAYGNQSNVVMTDVFKGLPGNTTETQWQLKPGSPAISAGEGGVDCGMFGGLYPYVLSTMPMAPSIYFLHTTNQPSNSMNVDVKAKSHK